MKKGIRCKSGTIPVAVFPPFKGKVYRTFAHWLEWLGRHDKRDKSEDRYDEGQICICGIQMVVRLDGKVILF